jgi:hypothetical protein
VRDKRHEIVRIFSSSFMVETTTTTNVINRYQGSTALDADEPAELAREVHEVERTLDAKLVRIKNTSARSRRCAAVVKVVSQMIVLHEQRLGTPHVIRMPDDDTE